MRASTYDPNSRKRQMLSASSVGHKSPALTHVRIRDIDQNQYQMDLVVREVNKRLHDDSTFFMGNRVQALPSYSQEEVTLGPTELGRGEFGIVYQVDGLHPQSCECPKCLLKSLYGAPEDRHKLNAKELDVADETLTPTVESSTIRTTSHGTSTNVSSSGGGTHHEQKEDMIIRKTKSSSHTEDETPITKDEYDDDQIIKWTDGVEKSINEMFSEEFLKEKQLQGEEDDHQLSDIDEQHDDISELSTGSMIRPTGANKSDTLQTKSLRENFDTYRKCYMQRHVLRQGRPRYAVKRLRDDLQEGETKYNAAIDLAVEAKFLAALKHPNIVRVRGTVGKPGHDMFMIMMDCLNLTLREKIIEWAYDTKIRRNATHNVFKRIFHLGAHYNQPADSSKVDPAVLDVHTERLMAAYDLVRGMKFLHSNKVLYRDLKPENIAFDVRGRLKIFDFGLAKELKPKDLEEPPDGYIATGLTGSRRYMAPEVVKCKNYGFAADVYSYSIVIWELFSGKVAYDDMDFNSHFEEVVVKGKRPSGKIHGIPKTLTNLMQKAWDPEPLRRVDFKYIRQILKHESKLLNHDHIENGHHHHLSNRTDYLMRQSARSQTNEMPNLNEVSEETKATCND